MKYLFTLGLILIAQPALSAETYPLPNVSGLKKIGQAQVFESPKPLNWVLPLSFDSDFSCSAGASANVGCQLKIFNRFNDETARSLKDLQASGRPLSVFRDVDTRIVQEVDEQITGDVAKYFAPQSFKPLKTLAMSKTLPYTSIYLRLKADDAQQLKAQYSSGQSLGTFSSSVTFRGEDIQEYTNVLRPDDLVRDLSALDGHRYKFGELHDLIADLVKKYGVQSFKVDEALAPRLAVAMIVALGVEKLDGGGYGYKVDRLKEALLNGALVDTTISGLRYKCVATLELKAGAASEVSCETLEN